MTSPEPSSSQWSDASYRPTQNADGWDPDEMDLSQDARQRWQDDDEDMENPPSSRDEGELSGEEEDDWGVTDMLVEFHQKYPPFSQRDDGVAWNASAIAPCYTRFLNHLAEETDTTAYKSIVLDCLNQVLQLAQNEALVVGIVSNTPSEPVTAMIVYVWLMVSHVHSTDCLPREHYAPITVVCGSYFRSAIAILEESPLFGNFSGIHFKSAIVFWEVRIAPTLMYSDDYNTQAPNWLSEHLEGLRSLVSAAPPLPPRNEKAKEWLRVLREGGVIHLTNVVFANVRTSVLLNAIKDKEDRKTMVHKTWQLLAGMDRTLLESIILGRICQDYARKGSSVRIALERNRWDQPGIYMNSIADGVGVAPTPGQWMAVCDVMEKYSYKDDDRHDKMANIVDQLFTPRWAETHPSCRRYMNDKPRRPRDDGFVVDTDPIELNAGRRSVVQEFLSNMRHRLREEGREKNCPTHHAVCEIGWATTPTDRLRQHRDHETSNYLMNLAEAAFDYLYPDSFQLHQFVLVNCWAPEHCWAGEIFLTEFAQGYIDEGCGFSHHPAGGSNHQAFTSLPLRDWTQCVKRALSDRSFRSMEENRQQYHAYCKRFDAEEADDLVRSHYIKTVMTVTRAIELKEEERRDGSSSMT